MTILVFNINWKTPLEKERLKSSVINNLRILVGILFEPIAFEGLRDNIFLTSISSVGSRKKEFILIGREGGENHENYFLSI